MVRVQEAVDVWSLGVVAFELLTGKPAFSMAGGKDQACISSAIFFMFCSSVPLLPTENSSGRNIVRKRIFIQQLCLRTRNYWVSACIVADFIYQRCSRAQLGCQSVGDGPHRGIE